VGSARVHIEKSTYRLVSLDSDYAQQEKLPALHLSEASLLNWYASNEISRLHGQGLSGHSACHHIS
jgi:hypothetical protein